MFHCLSNIMTQAFWSSRICATKNLAVVVSFVFLQLPTLPYADESLCKRYAASPDEPGVEGVAFEKLDTKKALPACERAMKDNPDDFVSAFRLSRVLLAANRAEEALPLVKQAIEAQFLLAHNALGFMYLYGLGVDADEAKAYEAFVRGHTSGHARSTHALATFHHSGTYVERDEERAAELYRQAAFSGFPDAAFALSQMLWTGDGIPANPKEALRLLYQAADGGITDALNDLAARLINGNGVERDVNSGYRYAVKASQNGSGYAAYLMGFVQERGLGGASDISSAVWAYRVSSSRGDPLGHVSLGRLLLEGKGVKRDLVRARDLFSLAAESGSIEAQARLGEMLMSGTGGPQDVKRALKLLEAASDHPVSKYVLGMKALEKSESKLARAAGLELLRQAADSGHADAQVEAALILVRKDSGFVNDTKTAINYLARAAKQGHPEALFQYGSRLLDGDGVRVNEDRGLKMLEQAAALGNVRASAMIKIHLKTKEKEAEQLRVTKALCELQIKNYNRGSYERDDGTRLYNTRNGKHWFERSGRLVPPDQAPDYRCPQ